MLRFHRTTYVSPTGRVMYTTWWQFRDRIFRHREYAL
jgi:hypothetical protein